MADLSFKEAEALQTAGGALWPQGPSGVSSLNPQQLLTTTAACEDQPKQEEAGAGIWRWGGMKEGEKMRSNSGAGVCLRSGLPSYCARRLGSPARQISGL